MPFLYLDEAFRFYALYTPLKLYLEGVLEPQLSLKNVDKLPLVALILPEFQKRYFKDSLEKLKNYQSEGGIALIARENPVLKVPSTGALRRRRPPVVEIRSRAKATEIVTIGVHAVNLCGSPDGKVN